MRWSDAARVGAALVAAALLLALVYFGIYGIRLFGRPPRSVRIAFNSAQGVKPNAEVRVQGVKVGEVRQVGLLGNKAVLGVVFEQQQLPDRVRARIAGTLLGFSSPQLELVPDPGGQVLPNFSGPVERAPVILGEDVPGPEALMPKADQLIGNLNQLATEMGNLARNLNQVAGNRQAQRNLLQITQNFAATSRNLERFARSAPAIGRNLERFSRSAPGLGRNLEAGSAEFRALLGTFRQTATRLDKELGQVSTQLNRTLEQSEGLVTDFRGSAGELAGAARELHAAAAENRPRLGTLLEGLQGTLTTLNATLAQAQGLVGDPQLRANLQQTAANVNAATETLAGIARDVQGLTGDPQVQRDLREAVSALRQATQQAATAFEQVNRLLGSTGDTIEGFQQKIEDTTVTSEVVYLPRAQRLQATADVTLPWTDDSFWRLGLLDAGEGNRLNLQYGQHRLLDRWTLPANTWFRYGIHASHLGIGADYGNPGRSTLSADLFNARHPRLDLRGNLRLFDYLDATLGLNGIFHRPDPVFGFRYQLTR